MALLGGPKQPPGLLGRMSPLLTYAGLGLLSQGPSLTPQSGFQGLGQGLALGMDAMRQNRLMGLQERKFAAEEEKRRMEAEAAATEARQAAAQREAVAQSLLARGLAETPQEAEMLASTGVGGKLLTAKDPMASFRTWQAMPEAEREAFAEYSQTARAPTVAIQMPGAQALADRSLTPEEARARDIPEEKASDYLVTKEGGLKLKPLSKQQLEELTAETAREGLAPLLDQYEAMASPTGLYGADADKARQTRREIAFRIARIKQPTGILTDKDIELEMENVPDVGGPYDAYVAPQLIDNLRKLRGIGQPVAPSVPGGIPLPQSETLPRAQPLPPGFVPD